MADLATAAPQTDAGACDLCDRVAGGEPVAAWAALLRQKIAATRQLYLEINRDCNLACSHCYNDSGPGAGAGLGLADVSRMLDWLRRRGARLQSVLLSGGEPTLHPEFAPILRSVAEHGWTPQVITNGTTMAGRLLGLVAAARARVQVSLAGADAEQDAALRGPHAFAASLQGIGRLVAAGCGPRLSVSVTLHRHNYQSVDEIVALLAGLGVRRIGFATLVRQGRAVANWAALALGAAAQLEACLAVGRQRTLRQGEIEIFTSGRLFTRLPALLRGEPPPPLPCTAAQEVSVDCQGICRVCEHLEVHKRHQGLALSWQAALGADAGGERP